jgi:hypothetical protein
MALIEAESPSGPLYRIGRLPDPLAWADWQYLGGGRFDDPEASGGFRVLYAAVAAFVETLQKWRPSVEALAALESIRRAPGVLDVPGELAGVVPSDWH